MKDIIIIGGGLAGLISSYLLAKAGYDVLLIEKKSYPFHRVCGEYLSNEAVPFLKTNSLYPECLSPSAITAFQLSDKSGKSKTYPLDLGGLGMSRYQFDYFIYQRCLEAGVAFALKCSVTNIEFNDDLFYVETSSGESLIAPLVIGAFGKRSNIDKKLERTFIKKRSPYVGVKYHIYTDYPEGIIGIHGYEKGYCGIVGIEDKKYNLCYLAHRNLLKLSGSIQAMEQTFLFKNPFLKQIFKNSQFLFDKPEVINEISFETKNPVENHILMAGDAAGMVAPIFGNGMAMAIRAGKTVAEVIIKNYKKGGSFSRASMEEEYTKKWNQQFKNRLWLGRKIQQAFDNTILMNLAFGVLLSNKFLLSQLMRHSHGRVF